SLVSLMTHAGLARRAATLAIPWAGAAVEVALIQVNHATATDLDCDSVAALVPTLLVIVVLEVRAWRREPYGTTQPGVAGADRTRRNIPSAAPEHVTGRA